MTCHCCTCGREISGLIPENMEKSSELYISGTCDKCKNEEYTKEFDELKFGEHRQFIEERIKKYGS